MSFQIHPGEHVGLVGESGSGKSVTSLAIMGLPPQRGVRTSGEVGYGGRNLLELSRRQLSGMRGKEIAMVFQDPMTSLNPVVTVGVQVGEIIERHFDVTKKDARRRAGDLLAKVGIPDPGRRLGEYPHQLSGGMRQRVLIAMALACEPRLLIADEPTTALDVTIQAQVLEVLKSLVADTDAALLMITHDLGVVAGLCDTVNVMYSGRIVESADRRPLRPAASPLHRGAAGQHPAAGLAAGHPPHAHPGLAHPGAALGAGVRLLPPVRTPPGRLRERAAAAHGDGGRRLRCLHPLEPTRRRHHTGATR